jgi:hypothetical protein
MTRRRALKENHVCEACGHAWRDRPWPLNCPACKVHVGWIASYRWPEDAIAHQRRVHVDIARRAVQEAAS